MSDIEVPDWLTKEFLQYLLRTDKSLPDKLVVTNYNVVNPLAKGENYLSEIIQINISYKLLQVTSEQFDDSTKISLIVKLPLQNNELIALHLKGRINEKEYHAYKELFPKLSEIIQTHENVNFLPKMFKSDLELLILEDLSSKGFKMANKRDQLDYQHGEIVVENLAKFHAAFVRLHETDPELVMKFGSDTLIKRDMDEDVKKILDPMMGQCHVEMLCCEFEKWPETRKFLGFLKKLKPKVWNVLLDCIHPEEDEFAVLNHGDLWLNNIMFKYNSQKEPTEIKFLDFQLLRYTSPTMDLLYFLYTSIRYNILKTHFHDLTKLYLNNLNKYLEKYGSAKRLSEEQFKTSLEKREIFCLIQCINALPFILGKSEDKDKTEKNPLYSFIEDERFRKVCVNYLEDFSERKWFKEFS